MDLHEAMQRTQKGDLTAFESLYEEHVGMVYGIALRILHDKSLAEDITQSVFVKMLAAPEAFQGGNFTGWIGRVTRNCAVDHLRRNNRTAALMDYAIDRDSGEIPPDDTAIAQIDGARARVVLAALPHEQREVLELAFFGGLSHHEIAMKTRIPLGTVKARIRAGLVSIRKTLKVGPLA